MLSYLSAHWTCPLCLLLRALAVPLVVSVDMAALQVGVRLLGVLVHDLQYWQGKSTLKFFFFNSQRVTGDKKCSYQGHPKKVIQLISNGSLGSYSPPWGGGGGAREKAAEGT